VTSNTQIKIGKNGKIRKIKTPSDKLDVMYKISKSNLSATAKENNQAIFGRRYSMLYLQRDTNS
jgi:hypothetical protein